MSNLFGDAHDSLSNFGEGDMQEAHASAGEGGSDASESGGSMRLGGEILEEDSLKMWWRRIHQYPLLTCSARDRIGATY
jgi:hypothetical protein